MSNYLKEFTGATGVYIGKLTHPMKIIGEDDDDKAHLDEDNPKVIMFVNSSDNHAFIKGKVLKSEQGMSHDAFKDPENYEEAVEDEIEREEEAGIIKADTFDILKTYRHIYVPEVVREARMHFYKVPRLGSFMAVPLVYNSCMSEDALDNAVNDFLEC